MVSSISQQGTRQQIEDEVLEALRQKELEWKQAPARDRDAARQRFIDALHQFNDLVLDGKIPKD